MKFEKIFLLGFCVFAPLALSAEEDHSLEATTPVQKQQEPSSVLSTKPVDPCSLDMNLILQMPQAGYSSGLLATTQAALDKADDMGFSSMFNNYMAKGYKPTLATTNGALVSKIAVVCGKLGLGFECSASLVLKKGEQIVAQHKLDEYWTSKTYSGTAYGAISNAIKKVVEWVPVCK